MTKFNLAALRRAMKIAEEDCVHQPVVVLPEYWARFACEDAGCDFSPDQKGALRVGGLTIYVMASPAPQTPASTGD